MVERIQKILAKAELSGAFLVRVNARFSNVFEVEHNARRTLSQELEDMHNAAEALRRNGFEADRTGLMLFVREAVKHAPRFAGDDYEANEARYSGAHDIEYADMF